MDFEYDAFRFHQRGDGGGPTLVLFTAPAGEVDQWADVDRLGPDNRLAPQREPAPARISSIRRFFADDARNTIPTAIVVGFGPAAAAELMQAGGGAGATTRLRLSTGEDGAQKPGLVIDGQHRLRGMQAVGADTIVPIVGILDADDLEMAFQFLVINNKNARVPRDHLRALSLNYPPDQLEARLRTARLSLNANLGSVGVLDEAEESPFRGMIAWPNNPPGNRIIVPAAIENMAAEARSLGFAELDDADVLNGYLIAIWSEIRDRWGHLFAPGSKLIGKVGLTCMTHFVSTTIKTWARNPRLREFVDVGDPEKVRANTRDILADLDPRFFEVDWRSTSYDTRAGRDLVLADLETMSTNIANRDDWFEDLKVVDRSSLPANAEAPAAQGAAAGQAG